jgi:hypothetical protein
VGAWTGASTTTTRLIFKCGFFSTHEDFQVWKKPTLENFQVWKKTTLENFQVWENATLENFQV